MDHKKIYIFMLLILLLQLLTPAKSMAQGVEVGVTKLLVKKLEFPDESFTTSFQPTKIADANGFSFSYFIENSERAGAFLRLIYGSTEACVSSECREMSIVDVLGGVQARSVGRLFGELSVGLNHTSFEAGEKTTSGTGLYAGLGMGFRYSKEISVSAEYLQRFYLFNHKINMSTYGLNFQFLL